MKDVDHNKAACLEKAIRIEERHPYLISFSISLLLTGLILFKGRGQHLFNNEIKQNDTLTIMSIEDLPEQKRVDKTAFTVSEKPGATSKDQVKRAKGSSESTVVDLAFHPDVVHPKPIKLVKSYPKSAEENDVEAVIIVELVITPSGKAQNVKVLRVKLKKDVDPQLKKALIQDFKKEVRYSLSKALFTPPVVEGKKVPVKMTFTLNYTLQ